MSRKSRTVGDIVPINCGQLMTDLDLMQKQISELKVNVSDLGDAHSQLISSKTDEIGDKLHTLLYFVRECMNHYSRNTLLMLMCVLLLLLLNVMVLLTFLKKRQGPANEECDTVGQNNPKKRRNDGEQSPDTNTQN